MLPVLEGLPGAEGAFVYGVLVRPPTCFIKLIFFPLFSRCSDAFSTATNDMYHVSMTLPLSCVQLAIQTDIYVYFVYREAEEHLLIFTRLELHDAAQ